MRLVPLSDGELLVQQIPGEKPLSFTLSGSLDPPGGREPSLLTQHHHCHWGLWIPKARSWESGILAGNPELIPQFPILPLGLQGAGSLLDSLGNQEAGVVEALVPVFSKKSVGTLFKIWMKRNQGDSNVLEQGLQPVSAASLVSPPTLLEAPVSSTGLPCGTAYTETQTPTCNQLGPPSTDLEALLYLPKAAPLLIKAWPPPHIPHASGICPLAFAAPSISPSLRQQQ